jgi:hypothetical protein
MAVSRISRCRHAVAPGGTLGLELVGDHDPWRALEPSAAYASDALQLGVSAALRLNVEDKAVLVVKWRLWHGRIGSGIRLLSQKRRDTTSTSAQRI